MTYHAIIILIITIIIAYCYIEIVCPGLLFTELSKISTICIDSATNAVPIATTTSNTSATDSGPPAKRSRSGVLFAHYSTGNNSPTGERSVELFH